MRKNFRSLPNRIEEAKKHISNEKNAGHNVYWDKHGQGIMICSRRDYDQEARYNADRYLPLKTDDDVAELFTHYEDEE